MVERRPAERPVESLESCVRIRSSVGNRNAFDAHHLEKPSVEMAPIASAGPSLAELPEDPVVVMDQVARAFAEVLRPRGSAASPSRGSGSL